MEDVALREKFNRALDSTVNKLQQNKSCLAAFLIGSPSHDSIWEWSDLTIVAIFDNSYTGQYYYYIMENDIPVILDIKEKNEFKTYLAQTNVADYYYCALSKSKILFCKDVALEEYFKESFYISDHEREVEMLLGFSEVVYNLNKVEKNFVVKNNIDNAVYFLIRVANGVSWLEVAKARLFPEREIVAQARLLSPELIGSIYDRLFQGIISPELIQEIIEECHRYLEDNTQGVYRPVINYLNENGSLKDFSMKTRDHGFGIDFLWLCRMGMIGMGTEPIKLEGQPEQEYYQIYFDKK